MEFDLKKTLLALLFSTNEPLSTKDIQAVITRYRMGGSPPDLLITIPKNTCGTLDFHRAEGTIAVGRAKTEEALDMAGLTA